jgi:hypothetical protein
MGLVYATKWGKGKKPSESETGFKAPRDTQSLGVCWMRYHRQAVGCFWVSPKHDLGSA